MERQYDRAGLRWEFRQSLSILRDGDQRLLDMRLNRRGIARVVGGTERWAVYTQGFWNPRVVMTHNDRTVAMIEGSVSGRNVPVVLASGIAYELRIRHEPAVHVSLWTRDGKELLRYEQRHARPRPRTAFEVFQTDLANDDLLMLVVLGCHVFLSIQAENAASMSLAPVGTNGKA